MSTIPGEEKDVIKDIRQKIASLSGGTASRRLKLIHREKQETRPSRWAGIRLRQKKGWCRGKRSGESQTAHTCS